MLDILNWEATNTGENTSESFQSNMYHSIFIQILIFISILPYISWMLSFHRLRQKHTLFHVFLSSLRPQCSRTYCYCDWGGLFHSRFYPTISVSWLWHTELGHLSPLQCKATFHVGTFLLFSRGSKETRSMLGVLRTKCFWSVLMWWTKRRTNVWS